MTDAVAVCELARPLPHFEDVPVELAGCHVLIISCALVEFEKPALFIENWPASPRAKIERTAAEWMAAHPERVVRLVSTGALAHHGAQPGCCFMVLHHAAKG